MKQGKKKAGRPGLVRNRTEGRAEDSEKPVPAGQNAVKARKQKTAPSPLESRIWDDDPILRKFRLRWTAIAGKKTLVRVADGPLPVQGFDLLLRIKALRAGEIEDGRRKGRETLSL